MQYDIVMMARPDIQYFGFKSGFPDWFLEAFGKSLLHSVDWVVIFPRSQLSDFMKPLQILYTCQKGQGCCDRIGWSEGLLTFAICPDIWLTQKKLWCNVSQPKFAQIVRGSPKLPTV